MNGEGYVVGTAEVLVEGKELLIIEFAGTCGKAGEFPKLGCEGEKDGLEGLNVRRLVTVGGILHAVS